MGKRTANMDMGDFGPAWWESVGPWKLAPWLGGPSWMRRAAGKQEPSFEEAVVGSYGLPKMAIAGRAADAAEDDLAEDEHWHEEQREDSDGDLRRRQYACGAAPSSAVVAMAGVNQEGVGTRRSGLPGLVWGPSGLSGLMGGAG